MAGKKAVLTVESRADRLAVCWVELRVVPTVQKMAAKSADSTAGYSADYWAGTTVAEMVVLWADLMANWKAEMSVLK